MNLYGFTPQEYKVIEELAKISRDIFVTICADDLSLENTDQDTDIFYSNKVTANKLIKIAGLANIQKVEKVHLDKSYRFKSKELANLEKNIYSNIYDRFECKPEDISLFLANNPYSEIEYVASKIVQNVRDKRI